MAKLYPFFVFILFSFILQANNIETHITPTDPDSTANLAPQGHARCTTHVKVNCATRTVELSAHQDFLFAGTSEMIVAPWSTGVSAHKIIVVPPGTWSWDATGLSCDHIVTTVDLPGAFYNGNSIDITGPAGICGGGNDVVQLSVNTNGYDFPNFDWSPNNDPLTPIFVDQAGQYSLTVTDDFGCSFSDQINLPYFPPFVPQLSSPQFICPEGDTSFVTVTQPFLAYNWSNGATGHPLLITEPGLYEVTVTNSNGCTGNGIIGVQNGGVGSIPISATSPAICPGQLDTLRILGGFTSIAWSNGVNTNNNIVNTAGIYTVTVTNIYGCMDSTQITVNPLFPPVIQTSAPPLCEGNNTIISVTGGNFPQYTWSSGQNSASITVNTPGTYTVTVSGTNICPTNTSISIATAPLPVATVAPPGQLTCTNTSIILDGAGSSAGPNFLPSWSTAGGNIVSGNNTLNPEVNGAGIYTLTMTNQTTGCTNTASVTVDQNTQVPVANAGVPTTLTCDLVNAVIGPGSVPANPNYVPSWTTANGSIIAGQNSWNPLINAPGTYVLTVNDTAIGCSAISSVTIDINTAPPVASIAAPGILSCTINSTVLDGTGSSSGPNFSYLWSSSNGSFSGALTGNTATATGIGVYQLLVTNTQTGCTATTSASVSSSVTLPIATALPPPMLTCSLQDLTIDATASSNGPGFTFNWTTANGAIQSGDTTLTPVVSAPGTYSLLLVNTSNQCSATLNVTVDEDVTPPIASAGPTVVLNCTNPVSTLDGTGSSSGPGIVYLWTTNLGTIVGGSDTPTPLISDNGVYQLLVTNTNNGCSSTANVTVQEDFEPPVVAIGTPNLITCVTLQSIVDGSGSSQGPGFTYYWTGANILSGQGTPQITTNQPGDFTLEVTDTSNGCSSIEMVTVEQYITAPIANAGPDSIINCAHPSITIGSNNNPNDPGFALQWSTTNGNFTSPLNGPTATINASGNYHLLITNTANGCTDTDELVVNQDFVPPAADAGNTFELNCIQNAFILNGSGSTGAQFVYDWTTNGGNIVNGEHTLSPLINASGIYTLLVTNNINGCTHSDQVQITQSADVPIAIAGPSPQLTCSTTDATLNGTGSTTGLTYNWTTSDGNIVGGNSTLTPLINDPGTYVLTVLNSANNCSAVSSVLVTENIIAPTVNAGPDNILTCTVATLPLDAQIVSSFSPNISYSWSTTNGQIVAGANTQNPTIGQPGNYFVTVTDIANGCTDEDELIINNDLNQPIAAIAIPATLTCALQQTALNTLGSSTGTNFVYAWNTPDGNFVSLNNPESPVINQPGTYNLLITNTDNGCTETAQIFATQDIAPPIAEAGPTDTLTCDNITLQLDGSGTSTGPAFLYVWTTIDGQINSGPGTLNPVVGLPGTYTLSVTNTQNGCSESDIVTITRDAVLPAANIASPAQLTCVLNFVNLSVTGTHLGPAPSFQWSTTSGNIVAGADTATPTVDAPGIYQLVVENTANGCTTALSIPVLQNIIPPVLNILPPSMLTCTVEQVSINSTVSPQTTLQWSTQDGNIIAGANSTSPVVDAPGLYTLVVTSTANGCTETGQIPVLRELNVPNGILLDLMPPKCNGTPGLLLVQNINGGIGPFQYSINGGQSFFPAQDIGNLLPGQYELVIRDANGCKIGQPINVPPPPQPFVSLPPEFKIRLGENQELEAVVPPQFPIGMIDTVIWSPLDGLTFTGNSIEEMLNPIAQPQVTTQYEVTIISPEGCESVSRTIIEVDRRLHIFAPNIIDLLDNSNNTFLIFSNDEAIQEIRRLQIFDRWGAMLFENSHIQPNDISAGWAGNYRGAPVNPAVFVWQAEVLLIDGTAVLLTGDVTVVR